MTIAFVRAALRSTLPVLVAAIAGLGVHQASAAEDVYSVLHTFCAGANCVDGDTPYNALTADDNGNLFGVTAGGGRRFAGVLYELSPNADFSKYRINVLRDFCNPNGCKTGNIPFSSPILDTSGNLFGTASRRGSGSCGTAYEFIPAANSTTAKPQMRHIATFEQAKGCHPSYTNLEYQGKEDGDAYDGTSPLFGMTQYGGDNDMGVVFKLMPRASGNGWFEQVLYTFCAQTDCTDGRYPLGNLTMDASGNLFGTTSNGRVFELSPGKGNRYTYRVIYTTTTDEAYTQIQLKNNGTIIGIANSGGETGAGTLFTLTPNACGGCNMRDTTYQYTVLHNFCSQENCADGAAPSSFVTDAIYNIFGTTLMGGANAAAPNSQNQGAGVIYRYFTDGTFSVAHNFCAQPGCTDGGAPAGLMKWHGLNLFGSTLQGGSEAHDTTGAGVVYSFINP